MVASVVIPAYNAEKYIMRAIDSALKCKRCDFEVVVIDDGSTDGTFDLCKRKSEKDSRLRIVHRDNGGVSFARNCGIEEARGRYIIFLDADDIFIENAFEKIMEVLCGSDRDMIICPYLINDEVKGLSREVNPFSEGFVSAEEFKRSIVTSTYMNFCWGKPFRRDFLLKNGIRFPLGVRVGEDVVFQINCLKYTPDMYCEKILLVQYEQIDTSVMHRYSDERFRELSETYNMRMDLAKTMQAQKSDFDMMYRDLCGMLLSYVRQCCKYNEKKDAALKIKICLEEADIRKILFGVPLKFLSAPKKLIVLMLRAKLYCLTTVLLAAI